MALHQSITRIKTTAIFIALTAVLLVISLAINIFPFSREAKGQARNNSNEFYVTPDGISTNPGTIDSPWNIKSALLGHNGDVQPGDTIWLRGGTYRHPDRSYRGGTYYISLQGTPDRPITVSAYPGERATIDGGLRSGATPRHVRIKDLEIIISENVADGYPPPDWYEDGYGTLNRPRGGIGISSGHDIKVINSVVHDNYGGIDLSQHVSGDSEMYGNIVYNTIESYGTYSQNHPDHGDWKYISDNIFFKGDADKNMNIHIYGEKGPLDRFILSRNIIFDGRTLVGGFINPNYLRMLDNILYDSNMQISYVDDTDADNVVITGNTVFDGYIYFGKAHNFARLTNVTISDNFEWATSWPTPRTIIQPEDGVITRQTLTRADLPIPIEPLVFLNPNKYDTYRANLAIMSFQGQTEAEVDMSSLLESGDTFHLKDPADFYGESVYVGTYTGSPVSVPLTGEFTVYVVLKNGQWGGSPSTKQENNIPEAIDDTYTVDGTDMTLTVSAPGVLANDTDADKDTLKAILVNGPSPGTVDLMEDGSFTYTLNPGFINQQDTFTYRVTDGIMPSTIATVTINVGNVLPPPSDAAPTAIADSATTNEDTSVTINVLGNDTDTGGTINAATVAIITNPANGTVIVNNNGTVTYTPAKDYSGTDTFHYTVQDNEGATSNKATVTVTVIANQPPVITTEQDSYAVEIGEILNILIIATDSDSSNITLDANVVDFPGSKLH